MKVLIRLRNTSWFKFFLIIIPVIFTTNLAACEKNRISKGQVK